MGFYIIEINDKYKQVVLFSADGELYCKDVAGLMPYTEPDLDAIRREVWEAIRKVNDMTLEEQGKIFKTVTIRDIIRKYSASEVIEKIRQHEHEKEEIQEEIRVGDEVIAKFSGIKYVIVKVEGSRLIGFSIENATCDIDAQFVEKTGRHFPEIAEVLRKMKEAE